MDSQRSSGAQSEEPSGFGLILTVKRILFFFLLNISKLFLIRPGCILGKIRPVCALFFVGVISLILVCFSALLLLGVTLIDVLLLCWWSSAFSNAWRGGSMLCGRNSRDGGLSETLLCIQV